MEGSYMTQALLHNEVVLMMESSQTLKNVFINVIVGNRDHLNRKTLHQLEERLKVVDGQTNTLVKLVNGRDVYLPVDSRRLRYFRASCFSNFFSCNSLGIISPRLTDVGEHIGNLLIREPVMRGHHILVRFTIDHWLLISFKNNLNQRSSYFPLRYSCPPEVDSFPEHLCRPAGGMGHSTCYIHPVLPLVHPEQSLPLS